jgi:hypothetical protein
MIPTVAVPPPVGEKFQRLAAAWRRQAQFLSNSVQIAMLEPYQHIIGMGEAVVPLILEEMHREPGQWFWALQAITEQDPVPPEARGKVREMTAAWLEWGRQHGLIES